MLNQERVRQMTKMAVFDQREGKDCKPMEEYFRKDYLSKELLKSFLTGTIAFFIIAGVWIVYSSEKLIEQLNSIDIRGVVIVSLICYILFMGIYILATYIIYNARYTAGRQEVKHFYACLKKVNTLYQKEEQL